MAANPYEVEVPNALQALLLGQKSYDTSRKSNVRSQASELYKNGNGTGALQMLLDSGDYDAIKGLQAGEAIKRSEAERSAGGEFSSGIASLLGGGSMPTSAPTPAPATATGTLLGGAPLPTATQPANLPPPAAPIDAPPRAPVQSSPTVWGDKEGQDAGIYEKGPGQAVPPSARANPPGQIEPAQPLRTAQAQTNTPQAAPAPTDGYAIKPEHVPYLAKAAANPLLPAGDRELAKTLLVRALDQSKPNEKMQYLQQLKASSNFQGTPLELEMQLRRASKTEVNVDTKGQNAFAVAGGSAMAKRFEKLSEEGDTATTDLALIGQLRDLGQVVKTGAPAAIQGWLANNGIKVGDNVGAVEAYGAIIDKLTPAQRIPGSGATSDYEGKMFKNSLQKLMNTPEGNEMISNTLAGLAQNKVDRAKIAEQALAGDLKPGEALKQLRDLPSPYANFKDFAKRGFKADPNSPASATPPIGATSQPGANASPPSVQGAKRASDGNYYVPDPARPGKYLQVQ